MEGKSNLIVNRRSEMNYERMQDWWLQKVLLERKERLVKW